MFEKAIRSKLRFDTPRGMVNIEDLWDLPLTGVVSLDNIAKDTNRAIKDGEEESFVHAKSSNDSIMELKMDIVKHVIKIRLEENVARNNAAARKDRREELLSLIADKKHHEDGEKSIEELTKMLEEEGI